VVPIEGGIVGPYALAIGPEGYLRIVETAERGGYPVQQHLTQTHRG
jgi:uncharacterized linocin/CFP29 family protein